MTAEILSFETGRPAELADDEPLLVVDVEGYEGPLDLLLALARQQKVDLSKISILALANQYLVFIEAARKIRLELAADYLVMAAWLAFLKSRLLLPEPATADGPSAEEMATALAGLLPKRLASIIAGVVGGPPRLADFSDKLLLKAAAAIKQWRVRPNGTEGYRTAEVTLGGVDTSGLSSKTFEARSVPGLYFIGEVIDVTGHLGGFNFQWAWSSGHAAGLHVGS